MFMLDSGNLNLVGFLLMRSMPSAWLPNPTALVDDFLTPCWNAEKLMKFSERSVPPDCDVVPSCEAWLREHVLQKSPLDF